jgi:hypothetical protein
MTNHFIYVILRLRATTKGWKGLSRHDSIRLPFGSISSGPSDANSASSVFSGTMFSNGGHFYISPGFGGVDLVGSNT